MISPFQLAIGTARNQEHRLHCRKVWNHHHKADRSVGMARQQGLHQLGYPKSDGRAADKECETNGYEMPDPPVRKHLYRRDSMLCQLLPFFFQKFRTNPVLLLLVKKLGFRGTVGQQKIGKEPADHGWTSLQDQEPSPTAESQPMDMIQNKP